MSTIQELLDQEREERMLVESPEYLKNKIAALEAKVAGMSDQSETIRILNNRIASFKSEIETFVTDNLGGNVGDDELRELAENFGVELTQRVQFTITATFNGYADVELGTDLSDIGWEIGNSITANLDFDGLEGVDNFDWETNDISVEDVEEM